MTSMLPEPDSAPVLSSPSSASSVKVDPIKQVIVVRTDIHIPPGKLGAQISHASVGAAFSGLRLLPDHLEVPTHDGLSEWLLGGSAKMVLACSNDKALIALFEQAQRAQLRCQLIKDAGKTVFKVPTLTVLGIGPAPASKIDAITGHLKPLK